MCATAICRSRATRAVTEDQSYVCEEQLKSYAGFASDVVSKLIVSPFAHGVALLLEHPDGALNAMAMFCVVIVGRASPWCAAGCRERERRPRLSHAAGDVVDRQHDAVRTVGRKHLDRRSAVDGRAAIERPCVNVERAAQIVAAVVVDPERDRFAGTADAGRATACRLPGREEAVGRQCAAGRRRGTAVDRAAATAAHSDAGVVRVRVTKRIVNFEVTGPPTPMLCETCLPSFPMALVVVPSGRFRVNVWGAQVSS